MQEAGPVHETQGYQGPRGDRPPRREGGRPGGRDFRSRRKVCAFCVDHTKEIDYKEVGRLRRFLSDRGKIEPRRKTGTCAKHQRRLSVALKRARFMALLPYTGEHSREAERGAPREYDRGPREYDRGPREYDRGPREYDRGGHRGEAPRGEAPPEAPAPAAPAAPATPTTTPAAPPEQAAPAGA